MRYRVATPGAPTEAEVAAAHARYFARLEGMFARHKAAAGFPGWELEWLADGHGEKTRSRVGTKW